MSAGYLKKCVGKKAHKTRDEAAEQRKQMIKMGKWRKTTSRVYRCDQCGDYHAGRINGAGQRRS